MKCSKLFQINRFSQLQWFVLPHVSVRHGSRRAVLALSFGLAVLVFLSPALTRSASASDLHTFPDRVTPAEQTTSLSDGLIQKVYLPSVSRIRPGCSAPASPNIFGVQLYGNTGSDSPYYDSMLGTGGDWVRVPILWSSVEPFNTSTSGYRWASADASVAAAIDACKKVIVTVGSAPSWAATSPNSVIDRALPSDLQEFLYAVVDRYNGDGNADAPGSPVVLHWELYNEPDATNAVLGYEGWGEYPEEYAKMLEVAYPAIHLANSEAEVLLGGLALDNFEDKGGQFSRSFLDDVLKAGGGEYFDIMNFHAYPLFGPDWITEINPDCAQSNSCQGPGLVEKTQFVRQTLAAYGLNDKDIMITESGWHSDLAIDQPSTPEIQARYVTQQYVQSMAAGVDVTIYFALVKPGNYPYDAGLIDKDTNEPKESYRAYEAAVAWLADAEFVRRIPPSETKAGNMDAYEFSRASSGRSLYVAWLNPAKMGIDLNGDGKPDVANDFENLRLSGNEAKVYDIYGNLVDTVIDDDGDVKILIGGAPRYIEIIR